MGKSHVARILPSHTGQAHLCLSPLPPLYSCPLPISPLASLASLPLPLTDASVTQAGHQEQYSMAEVPRFLHIIIV